MPAGVTWPVYLRFFTAAMLSMFAGAQVVHTVYKPLEDLDEFIEKERKQLLKSQASTESSDSEQSHSQSSAS